MVETNLDHATLWTHVKAAWTEYRKHHFKDNWNCKPDHSKVKPGYVTPLSFIISGEIKINLDNLQKYLKVSDTTDDIKIPTPDSIIEEGGKMFVYLNSCPAEHWENFYHHLLFSKSNSEMILSVLNAKKNSHTKGGRIIANKFLGRLAGIFGFEYKHFANETMWVNNITFVRGKNKKGVFHIVKPCPHTLSPQTPQAQPQPSLTQL